MSLKTDVVQFTLTTRKRCISSLVALLILRASLSYRESLVVSTGAGKARQRVLRRVGCTCCDVSAVRDAVTRLRDTETTSLVIARHRTLLDPSTYRSALTVTCFDFCRLDRFQTADCISLTAIVQRGRCFWHLLIDDHVFYCLILAHTRAI